MRIWALAGAVPLVLLGPATADDPLAVTGSAGDSTYSVDVVLSSIGGATGSTATGSSAVGAPVEYIRASACGDSRTRMALDPACPADEALVEQCLDGSDAANPVWARTQEADGSWSEWAAVTWYTCANDAALLEAIEREWSQLRPEPSVIALQPGNGRVLANVPTIAMAVDAPRLHSTTLLGAGVEIRATPSGYVWQWGDGESTATTDAGRPYPNATVTHTYAHASGDPEVELATTWTGEYRVNGGQWVSFDSTIESSAESVTLAVSNPRSRLVDCDVTDRCQLHASG